MVPFLDYGTSLETQDTILINFPRKYNDSGTISQPVVIEDVDEPWNNTVFSRTIDSTSTEINGRGGRYYYPRPTHLQIKSSQRGQPSTIEAVGNVDKMTEDVIQIENMSCRNTDDDVFFRASIRFTKGATTKEPPVIENAEMESCKVNRAKDEYTINFEKDRFRRCGVTDCFMESEKFYCLDLRFPQIPGLRLKDDSKITLRCKVQERITSHTKQLKVKTLDTSGRMVPRIVTGGLKNPLQTDVGLYRKTFNSENVFDTRIQSGGTLILGEEVLLRVLVREGDGWRYSRISELTVHYVEKKQRKKIMNSLWILDANGCLNPDVREICSREQYRISPLESYLIFRAFMFENMKENEEMVLTVKVVGCLEGADCVLNCPAGHNRRSRSVSTRNSTTDWENDISFSVALPKEKIADSFNFRFIIPYVFIILALVIIMALLCTIRTLLRQRVVKH